LVSNWLAKILETITPTGRARLQGASRSAQWPAFRAEYAKTHLPVCAICGGTAALNLHHLRPFHAFPELELVESNVVWLCNKNLCHIRVGHLSNFQSINPKGAEDIVIWRDKIRNRPMTVEEIKADFNQQ
jgi:putative intracellular protease/amidase